MKYRKRPMVVEAIKFDYSYKGIIEAIAFLEGSAGAYWKNRRMDAKGEIVIKDSKGEDRYRAEEGDYIVKDNGEFYPFSEEQFLEVWEECSDD